MSSAAFTDLVALTTPAVGDVIAIVDVSDSTQSPSGSTKQLTLANLFVRGTVTTSQPIIAATQTWNAGGVTFAGVSIAISNTASAAASLPFQVLGGAAGATNLFSVRIDGLATVTGNMTVTGTVTSTFSGNLTGNVTGNASGSAGSVAASAITGTTLAANVVTTSITALATVVTGVWNATAVGAIYGGTAQTTWTTGDMLYASGANTLAKRGIGSTGDVLTVAGGVPTWAAVSFGGGALQASQVYATKGTVTALANGASQDLAPPLNQASLFVLKVTSPTGDENLGYLCFCTNDADVPGTTTSTVVNASVSITVAGIASSNNIRVTNVSMGHAIDFNWAFLSMADAGST